RTRTPPWPRGCLTWPVSLRRRRGKGRGWGRHGVPLPARSIPVPGAAMPGARGHRRREIRVPIRRGSSSSAKRRKSGAANTEGEPSQAATVQNAVTQPPLEDKERSASKLLVLAPGRAALPSAAPNLNIGMDPLSASPSSLVQGEVNAAASSQSNASLSQMDERELKRERRKQSNRESARRSRLRKQQECEELSQKVSELTAANGTLRSELDQLKKDCKTMETENKQLMGKILSHDDKMQQSEGPSVVTTLSIQVEAPEPHQGGDGKAS
uniref:BZIP domain-containing protein n=1 Tax=Aegilops tauschii subsp. strangulata TaxID=200361 RepID=A0A453M6M2_AEGTS